MHLTTFLCLTLLLAILGTTIQLQQYNDVVFAQEEEEEEDDKGDKEEKEEEEGKDSDKEEEKEEEGDSKEEEQPKDEPEQQQQQQNETVPTPTLLNFTNDQLLNFSQPVASTAVETNTEQAQPVAQQEQFNATCSCFTDSLTGKPTTPPLSNTPNQPQQQGQIPITIADIIDSESLGQELDPVYTDYYKVSNLFDNVINADSYWSQAGFSGFAIEFNGILDQYQVCSIELNNIYNPKNTPYVLDIGVSKNYTGVIDQVNEKIQLDKCVRDMNQMVMMFNKDNLQSKDFISIGEIKLFGSKLGTTVMPPTTSPEQPIIPPPLLEQPEQPNTIVPYENATKINIEDSTAEIDIKNSTVTFKFDPLTATFVGQSMS